MPLGRIYKSALARFNIRRSTYKSRKRRTMIATRRLKPMRRTQGSKPYRLPLPLPSRILTKMTFEQKFILSQTYPDVDGKSFRLNSLYDPDYATGGDQPGWYDLIKDYYRANIVRGCKYEITFLNDSSEAATVSFIVTSQADGPIVDTLKWQTLRPYQGGEKLLGHSTGASNRWIIKRYCDIFKLNGLSKTDSRLTQANPMVTTMVLNPNIGSFLQVKAECTDQVGTFKVLCAVKLTFYAEFFNNKIAIGEDA